MAKISADKFLGGIAHQAGSPQVFCPRKIVGLALSAAALVGMFVPYVSEQVVVSAMVSGAGLLGTTSLDNFRKGR